MNGRPSHYREPAPTIQRGDIAALYRSRDTDPLWAALNGNYMPPQIFEHGRETLVAEIAADKEEGCAVRVYETRYPPVSIAIEADGFRLAFNFGDEIGELAGSVAWGLSVGQLHITAIAPAPEGES